MLKVMEKRCNECLFSDAKVVGEVRAREVIKDCLESDHYFVCHKASIEGETVCCKGFWDEHKKDVFPTRIALAFNLVTFTKI